VRKIQKFEKKHELKTVYAIVVANEQNRVANSLTAAVVTKSSRALSSSWVAVAQLINHA